MWYIWLDRRVSWRVFQHLKCFPLSRLVLTLHQRTFLKAVFHLSWHSGWPHLAISSTKGNRLKKDVWIENLPRPNLSPLFAAHNQCCIERARNEHWWTAILESGHFTPHLQKKIANGFLTCWKLANGCKHITPFSPAPTEKYWHTWWDLINQLNKKQNNYKIENINKKRQNCYLPRNSRPTAPGSAILLFSSLIRGIWCTSPRRYFPWLPY